MARHRIFFFFVYVISVSVVGALLAPPLYWLVEHIPPFNIWAGEPFRRIADRAFLLVALVGLYPMIKACLEKPRQELGFCAGNTSILRCILRGAAYGAVMLLVVVGLEAGLHLLTWDDRRSALDLTQSLLSAMATGLIVSLIEETFFRGICFGILKRVSSSTTAVVATAFLYSGSHFIHSQGEPDVVLWNSGFLLIVETLKRIPEIFMLGPFLALLIAGALLARIREKTGHIFYNIGIHAAWIVVIKVTRRTTHFERESSMSWLATADDHVKGYLAFACLLVAWLGTEIYWRCQRAEVAAIAVESTPALTEEIPT